jgi:hypothetical protein
MDNREGSTLSLFYWNHPFTVPLVKITAVYIPNEQISGSGTSAEATIHAIITINPANSVLLNSRFKYFFITKNLLSYKLFFTVIDMTTETRV